MAFSVRCLQAAIGSVSLYGDHDEDRYLSKSVAATWGLIMDYAGRDTP